MKQSSAAAYAAHNKSGASSAQRILICKLLKKTRGQKWTRREIAHRLGLETSSVAGRVNELLATGKVREVGTKKDPFTKKTVGAICL